MISDGSIPYLNGEICVIAETKVRILRDGPNALVAELADAVDSKSTSERSAGSSPAVGTNRNLIYSLIRLCSSVIERFLGTKEVVGLIPTLGSKLMPL